MYLYSYAYQSPNLHLQSQSVAIRAAYLVADEAYVCGDLFFSVFINKTFNTDNPQFALQLMEENEQDPETKKAFQGTLRTMKSYNAMKHKPGTVIKAMKSMEKTIVAMWDKFRSTFIAVATATGLPELGKIPEGGALGILGSSMTNPELDDKDNMPCSKILLLDVDDENAPTERNYFMLPHEYAAMHQADTGKGFDFANWHEPAFSFYNLNILTAAELMLVREQLRPAAQPFCEAIDKWSAMIPTFFNLPQSYGWYQQFVKPAAAALQQAIDANKILSDIPRLTGNDTKIDFHIGEAPTQAIWLFFDMQHGIPQATTKVLQKPAAQAFAAKRKPYFSIKTIAVPEEQILEAGEITAVKKSIVFE